MTLRIDYYEQFQTFVDADAALREEIVFRRALVGLAGVLLWLTLGAPILAVWAIGYVALDWLYVRTLLPANKSISPQLFWSACGLSLFTGLWIASMAIYLAFINGGELHAVAACIVVGQALHCISSHSGFGAAFLIDLALVALSTVGVTVATATMATSVDLQPAIYIAAIAVLLYFVHSVRKIVEERIALKRRIEAEAQGEKMKALGKLTSGVAHDFNNILTVISGNIELVKTGRLVLQSDELLEEALSASRNAAALVSQLLAYSRKSKLNVSETQLNQLLSGIGQIASRLLPATAHLEIELLDDETVLLVDGALLETAILNLILNARDAIGDRPGHIRLTADRRSDQSVVAISVADDGPGLTMEETMKATEPFFTTKPVGKGSGLGLSMVNGFAEQSGGELLLENILPHGLRASITLPV